MTLNPESIIGLLTFIVTCPPIALLLYRAYMRRRGLHREIGPHNGKYGLIRYHSEAKKN